MIASGYLPYMFSECLCNAKLVYALNEAGIEVDVISRVDLGPSYSDQWTEPWCKLQPNTFLIQYELGDVFTRYADYVYSGLKMDCNFISGIRWARRAYEKALELMKEHEYDAVLTRSPSDMSHTVGYKLKKNIGIKWVANWNDPAAAIWPGLYKHNYNKIQQRRAERYAQKMLAYADITTFPSETLRDHFIEHFPLLANKRTEVIPHIGLSDSIFPEKTRAHNKKLLMCHSGNLSSERNPELTFKALREIVDAGFTEFEFHIMGRINDYTNRLIEKYDLAAYVMSIGSYSYMEALEKLQQYDVLVLLEAQLDKGIFFASKITDYTQTGIPILAISPSCGYAHDMITEYNAGIFADNTDYLSIKSALLKIIELWNSNRLSEYSSTGLYKSYSPEQVVKQYLDLMSK